MMRTDDSKGNEMGSYTDCRETIESEIEKMIDPISDRRYRLENSTRSGDDFDEDLKNAIAHHDGFEKILKQAESGNFEFAMKAILDLENFWNGIIDDMKKKVAAIPEEDRNSSDECEKLVYQLFRMGEVARVKSIVESYLGVVIKQRTES